MTPVSLLAPWLLLAQIVPAPPDAGPAPLAVPEAGVVAPGDSIAPVEPPAPLVDLPADAAPAVPGNAESGSVLVGGDRQLGAPPVGASTARGGEVPEVPSYQWQPGQWQRGTGQPGHAATSLANPPVAGRRPSAAAGLLQAALKPPAAGRVPGRPLGLGEVLADETDRQRQGELIRAYWQLSLAVAGYHFTLEEHAPLARLAELQGDQTTPALAAAQATALARVRDAQLAVVEAQHELAAQKGHPADTLLPLPDDQPLAGPYRTHYAALFTAGKRAREQRRAARRIHDTLPLRMQTIEARAAAARAAERVVHELAEPVRRGGDASGLLAACEKWHVERKAFLAAVRNYNFAVADYALLAAESFRLAAAAPSAGEGTAVTAGGTPPIGEGDVIPAGGNAPAGGSAAEGAFARDGRGGLALLPMLLKQQDPAKQRGPARRQATAQGDLAGRTAATEQPPQPGDPGWQPSGEPRAAGQQLPARGTTIRDEAVVPATRLAPAEGTVANAAPGTSPPATTVPPPATVPPPTTGVPAGPRRVAIPIAPRKFVPPPPGKARPLKSVVVPPQAGG